MTLVVGIICSALWLVYLGQVVSVVNLDLAQRLGLQESPRTSDALSRHLELWTARWDLLWLWTLPLAGLLILVDHSWWPYAAMIGGGAYVDAGGREAVKVIGLRQQGVRTGSTQEHRLMISTYAVFVAVGALAIVSGLVEVT